MKVSLRVRPGSSRPLVGGSHDGALVVKVSERAVDGRATEAALQALAKALQIPRRDARLVSGATSRTKIVEVPDDCRTRITELLAR